MKAYGKPPCIVSHPLNVLMLQRKILDCKERHGQDTEQRKLHTSAATVYCSPKIFTIFHAYPQTFQQSIPPHFCSWSRSAYALITAGSPVSENHWSVTIRPLSAFSKWKEEDELCVKSLFRRPQRSRSLLKDQSNLIGTSEILSLPNGPARWVQNINACCYGNELRIAVEITSAASSGFGWPQDSFELASLHLKHVKRGRCFSICLRWLLKGFETFLLSTSWPQWPVIREQMSVSTCLKLAFSPELKLSERHQCWLDFLRFDKHLIDTSHDNVCKACGVTYNGIHSVQGNVWCASADPTACIYRMLLMEWML